jgi:Mce-associated membrane protein
MDDGVEDGGAVVARSAREARTELIPRVPGRADDTEAAGAHARPDAQSRPAGGAQRTMVIVLALLLVTIVAGAAAYICWAKARDAEAARPTGNLAFVDKAVTSQVRDQVSKAVEAIYSYDYTRLNADEQRALSFITGGYADEFKQNFAKVRALGPQQKASLVSTVAEAGVERITDRRATLLLFVNQVGHRADSAAPLKASVRMAVTAERVDGQWKVSETSPR